jgi:LPS-assembly lipoprotein
MRGFSKSTALACIFGASLSLSACGFQPLYGTQSNGQGVITELAATTVQTPNQPLDRTLRLLLEDQLRADGSVAPLYQVTISSSLSVRDVAVQQDTDVTRKNLVLTSIYRLTEIESGDLLFNSQAIAIAAYNRVGSEFANIIAERDARERAANQAAEEIRAALAVFFQRRGGS